MHRGQNLLEKTVALVAAVSLAFMVGTAAGMMWRDAVDPWDPTAPLVATTART
jgi:hypothetical protein